MEGYKITILMFLVFLSFTPKASAFDGEFKFGKFFNSNLRSMPGGGEAQFYSSVEVGHQIKRFRPYVQIETLMDEFKNNYKFHPSSIKFSAGLTIRMVSIVFLDVKHMCWHPIDTGGLVEEYDYIGIKVKF